MLWTPETVVLRSARRSAALVASVFILGALVPGCGPTLQELGARCLHEDDAAACNRALLDPRYEGRAAALVHTCRLAHGQAPGAAGPEVACGEMLRGLDSVADIPDLDNVDPRFPEAWMPLVLSSFGSREDLGAGPWDRLRDYHRAHCLGARTYDGVAWPSCVWAAVHGRTDERLRSLILVWGLAAAERLETSDGTIVNLARELAGVDTWAQLYRRAAGLSEDVREPVVLGRNLSVTAELIIGARDLQPASLELPLQDVALTFVSEERRASTDALDDALFDHCVRDRAEWREAADRPACQYVRATRTGPEISAALHSRCVGGDVAACIVLGDRARASELAAVACTRELSRDPSERLRNSFDRDGGHALWSCGRRYLLVALPAGLEERLERARFAAEDALREEEDALLEQEDEERMMRSAAREARILERVRADQERTRAILDGISAGVALASAAMSAVAPTTPPTFSSPSSTTSAATAGSATGTSCPDGCRESCEREIRDGHLGTGDVSCAQACTISCAMRSCGMSERALDLHQAQLEDVCDMIHSTGYSCGSCSGRPADVPHVVTPGDSAGGGGGGRAGGGSSAPRRGGGGDICVGSDGSGSCVRRAE
jgi:hypothetical protein